MYLLCIISYCFVTRVLEVVVYSVHTCQSFVTRTQSCLFTNIGVLLAFVSTRIEIDYSSFLSSVMLIIFDECVTGSFSGSNLERQRVVAMPFFTNMFFPA
jgi:hypothetical protein